MKILMFGTGVIGTIYGHALAQAGHDVTHYVRPGKSRMLAEGIRLKLLDGRQHPPLQVEALYMPKLAETLANEDGYELVIVPVRHYQLDSALSALKDRIGDADVLLFSGNWKGFDGIEKVLPRSRFLLGFPVAGGGYQGATLDGALLDEIHLGELYGRSTLGLARICGVFKSAGLKVEIQPNMKHWLWVHFAINSGIIGAAFKAGSAGGLLNSLPHLHTAILAGREALEVCRARGVNADAFQDAEAFRKPAWLGAAAIWLMMRSNLPARKIMETHSAVDELQAMYRDVLRLGEALGVPMPHYAALKSYVDHPPVLRQVAATA